MELLLIIGLGIYAYGFGYIFGYLNCTVYDELGAIPFNLRVTNFFLSVFWPLTFMWYMYDQLSKWGYSKFQK